MKPQDTTKPCYLYRICNQVTGQDYVGISITPRKRWYEHKYAASHAPKYYLHRSMHKYGVDNFTFKILAKTSWTGALQLEKLAIALGMGSMNLTRGGEGVLGMRHTPEAKKKQSEKRLKWNAEHPEELAAFNAAKKGRKHSAETKALISTIVATREHKPHSEETKKKLSIAHTGKKLTEEHKQKLRETSLKQPPHSPEALAKMSAANKGKTLTDEHKQAVRVFQQSLKGSDLARQRAVKAAATRKAKAASEKTGG